MSDKGELFYIQDTRQVVGNCVSWWARRAAGYTCELDKAGMFDTEFCKTIRDTDVAWPCEMVENLVVRHVRLGHLLAEKRRRQGGG